MLFYAFKMALAIVFLCENAVEAIQISFISVHLPLCYFDPMATAVRTVWIITYSRIYDWKHKCSYLSILFYNLRRKLWFWKKYWNMFICIALAAGHFGTKFQFAWINCQKSKSILKNLGLYLHKDETLQPLLLC